MIGGLEYFFRVCHIEDLTICRKKSNKYCINSEWKMIRSLSLLVTPPSGKSLRCKISEIQDKSCN